MFKAIEEQFNVIYPDNPNATYESILNYSKEKNGKFQRWYRYKEGFSVQFVKKIIEEYGVKETKIILDPFSGSGTTLIAANELEMQGIGFEVNPFSFFLSQTKQNYYTNEDKENFKKQYLKILSELQNDILEEYDLPELSISAKVFQEEAEKYFMSCYEKIKKIEEGNSFNLLKLGWLSSLEELSNYRKAGNGLKKRKTVKPIIVKKDDVLERLEEQYRLMYEDLQQITQHKSNVLYNKSCIDFSEELGSETVDGIIFSPPYANCFDYTEIYKLELWFGEFVHSYNELKELRKKSLRSHLNVKYDDEELINSPIAVLNEQISQIKNAELWDKRIPKMLNGYFQDMFNVIDNCYKTLKKGGFCSIVVGNSAYGGIIIPTDLILSLYAEAVGFEIDKIEVDRYIITSSQQYEKTKDNAKYLRESVICLKK